MAHVSGYTFTTSSSSLNDGRRKSTGSFQVFDNNKKHNYVLHERDNKLIEKIQNEISSPEPSAMGMGMGMGMGTTVASADRVVDIIKKTRRRRRQQHQRRVSSITSSTTSSITSRRKKPLQQKKRRKNRRN